MTDWDDDADLRRRAERAADAKLSFRGHLLTYLLVVGGLTALNLLTSPSNLWVGWVAFGWGLGLAAHGAGVYGVFSGQRERMIEAELTRLREARR
jgi:hypothetical protein